MLFLFTRVGPTEQKSDGSPIVSLSMPQPSLRELKKAKSTPTLRINIIKPTFSRTPTTYPALAASSRLAPHVLGLSPASACFSPIHVFDQTGTKQGSLTSKICYRLSSFNNRNSGAPLLQQDSTPGRDDHSRAPDAKTTFPCAINPPCSLSPIEENLPSNPDETRVVPVWNTRSRAKSALDQRPPLYITSKAFFKEGFSKAHKFLGRALEGFSDKDDENDVSEDSHNGEDEEDDLNRLYSNEMVPLDFPEEGDEDSTSSSSSPFAREFENDRRDTPKCSEPIPAYRLTKHSLTTLPSSIRPLATPTHLRPCTASTISSPLNSALPRAAEVKLQRI